MSNPVKQKLRSATDGDIASTRVAEAAHDVIDRAAERATEVERNVREVAANSAQKLDQGQEQAKAQLQQSMRDVEGFVREKPLATAGIAFAAGVVLTTLLRK